MLKIKNCVPVFSFYQFVFIFMFVISHGIFSQTIFSTPPSVSLSKVLEQSFSESSSEAITRRLQKEAEARTAVVEKQYILSVLSLYQERLGQYEGAAQNYQKAARIQANNYSDSLLLDSARCFIAMGEFEKAEPLIRTILVTNFDQNLLLRARLYSAFSLLERDKKTALSQLLSFADNESFASYGASILFTLWWSEGDKKHAEALLNRYPDSPEALVIRGEASISPAGFWYLMGRNEKAVSAFASNGEKKLLASSSTIEGATVNSQQSANAQPSVNAQSSADSQVKQSVPSSTAQPVLTSTRYQQLGFFKTREYAEELVKKIAEKGFNAIIRSETRPSGTVYHAVLVPEDTSLSVGARLKDAGFESFLIVE